jgi:hypothetical protein
MRHGDRTPIINAFEGSASEQMEASFWAAKAGKIRARHEERFPIVNPNRAAFDVATAPWGILTDKGIAQATERGRRLGKRYRPLLADSLASARAAIASASSASSSSSATTSSSAAATAMTRGPEAAVIAAAASNFNRTQMTAQCALDGIFSAIRETASAAGGGSSSSWSSSAAAVAASVASGPVPIAVAPSNVCAIGTFDSGNGLMAATRRVFASASVMGRERELASEAKKLIEAIPFFSPPGIVGGAAAKSARSHPPSGDDGVSGSRFMWIRAYDYMATSKAHGRPLLPAVAPLAPLARRHLTWRFRQLFSNVDVLALSSRHLLRTILANAQAAAAASSVVKSAAGSAHTTDSLVVGGLPPFHLFSGHDVTIMPLLYALASAGPVWCKWASGYEAELAAGEAAASAVPWPGYASSVAFELADEGAAGGRAEEDAVGEGRPSRGREHHNPHQHQFVLRWRFDNEQLLAEEGGASDGILLRPHDEVEKGGPDDVAVHMEGSLTLERLAELVESLDRAAPSYDR